MCPHLAVLDPAKKPFEQLIFPTKYGIPKSSKPVSHWLSKCHWFMGSDAIYFQRSMAHERPGVA